MNKSYQSQNPIRLIGSLAFCAVVLLALPVTTAKAAGLDLSSFQDYAITDLGNNTNFGWNSGPVKGNVLVGNGVKVQLSGGNNGGISSPGQYLYTDGTANISGSLQNPITTQSISTLTTAADVTAAKNASTYAASLAPTQTYGNIQNTTTIVGNGGLNVISVHNIQNAKLTLVGSSNDVFVFNVTGGIQTNQPMTLSGISASQVLFNLTGSGNVFQTSGGNVLYGTYLATNGGQFQFSNLNLTGQLINTGGNVQFVSGSQLQSFVPFASSGGATPPTAPTVTTPTSASVTATSATLGGNVTSTGGASLTAVGVVYAPTATNPNPQLGGPGVTNVTSPATTGVFTVNVNGLMPSTQYSYTAYATNSAGTGYSSTGTFTTPAATIPPCPNYVTYNLTWSGNTKYLQCLSAAASGTNGLDGCGRPYVSGATATGQITLDLCKLQNFGGGYGGFDFISGPGSLCPDGIVSFTMTVTVPPGDSGGGTYTYTTSGSSDFQTVIFDFGGLYSGLDFTKNLVGQLFMPPYNYTNPDGSPAKWEDPNQDCSLPLNGEFVFNGNFGTTAPQKQSLKGIVITDSTYECGPKYDYLQLTSFTPSCNCTTVEAANLNLGSLANYAVVDLGNGTTFGWNSGPVNGSVLVGNGVKVQLSGGNNGGFSTPGTQFLYTDGTANISGNLQNPITTVGVSGGTATTQAAILAAQNVSNYAAGLAPTQTFGTINNTTTITGNGGLNVISVANIQNAKLTLKGGPTDVFVINVSGQIQTNQPMTLSGISASQVLFNLTGTGTVFQTSGGDVSYGTYLATNGGQFQFSNLNLTGALINTAGNIQLVSGSQIMSLAPFAGCPPTNTCQ